MKKKTSKTEPIESVEPRNAKDASHQVDKLAVDAEKNAIAKGREAIAPHGFAEKAQQSSVIEHSGSQSARHH